MQEFVSTVFVDFGAKNTGVVLLHGRASEPMSQWDRRAMVITAGSGKTYSMVNRRQKRHQKRNIERRYMAKRLLRLILTQGLGFSSDDLLIEIEPNQSLIQFLFGLLNRRGFTYADDLTQAFDFDDISFDRFREICCGAGLSIPENSISLHMHNIANADLETVKNRLNSPPMIQLTEQITQITEIEREERKPFKNLIATYRNALEQIVSAESSGHKPRSVYFREIGEFSITKPKFLEVLKLKQIHPEQFLNLIGNISNLQLRLLRKYFNDPNFKERDQWLPERLMRLLIRYVHSFHAKELKEKERRRGFYAALRADADPIQVFMKLDPAISIPPFEDQNNRRPPKCQSLILDPQRLDYLSPAWREWVRRIRHQHPELIISCDLQLNSVNTEERVLQRFLERSREADQYALRKLASSKVELSAHSEFSELSRWLGKDQSTELVNLARRFYSESRFARGSVWSEEDKERTLRVCGATTPAKVNVVDTDLARILRLGERVGARSKFEDLLRENPVVEGRSRLKGVLEGCAKLQKELQQRLKLAWETCKTGGARPEFVEKDQWEALQRVNSAAKCIADHIRADYESISNPWSLGSISQLLGDRDGHSRTCRICGEDNYWRVMPVSSQITSARAVALPADSVRPFDGLIHKLVCDQAEKIATAKKMQVDETDFENGRIIVVIEENAFSSTEEMFEFKKLQSMQPNKKSKDRRLASIEDFNNVRAASRDERLKNFSDDRCPYKNVRLGRSIEVDHIIPRSLSLKKYGSVFNHEANLILVSREGNQEKGEAVYSLSNLSNEFKRKHFGEFTDWQIAEKVESVIEELIESKRINLQYGLLTMDEQRAMRFGLFIENVREKIVPTLIQSNRVRVNGTQRYLAREVRRRLLSKIDTSANLEVEVRFASADDTSEIRRHLAKSEASLAKLGRQSVASHVIDALIGGLQVTVDQAPARISPELTDGRRFAALLPTRTEIVDLIRRPRPLKWDTFSSEVFKAGMYKENFLPVWLRPDCIGIGFSVDKLLKISNRKESEFWTLISPMLVDREGARPSVQLSIARSELRRPDQYFVVDKNVYYKLASEVGISATPKPEAIRQCQAVEKIRYFTRREDFFKRVWPEDSTGPISLEELKKGLALNVDCFGAKGALQLPVASEWKRAIDELRSYKLPRKSGRELQAEFLEIGARIFRRAGQSGRQAVRKTYSLPLISSPSGGFRIHRKGLLQPAYQIQVSGIQARGLRIENDKTFSPVPGLISESVTSIKSGDLFRNGRSLNFETWVEYPVTPELKNRGILYAKFKLGTKSRPDVQLEVTYELVSQQLAVGAYPKDLKINSLNCPPHLKFRQGEPIANKELGKPKEGNVEVIQLKRDSIVIRYVRESKSVELINMAMERHSQLGS